MKLHKSKAGVKDYLFVTQKVPLRRRTSFLGTISRRLDSSSPDNDEDEAKAERRKSMGWFGFGGGGEEETMTAARCVSMEAERMKRYKGNMANLCTFICMYLLLSYTVHSTRCISFQALWWSEAASLPHHLSPRPRGDGAQDGGKDLFLLLQLQERQRVRGLQGHDHQHRADAAGGQEGPADKVPLLRVAVLVP